MVWSDLKYANERAHPFRSQRPVDEVKADADLLKFYREWAKRRQESSVLRRGDFKVVLADDMRGVLGFKRSFGGQEIVAAFNSSDKEATVSASELGIEKPDAWSIGFGRDLLVSNQIVIAAKSFWIGSRPGR
jgi:glycosidase